MARVARVALQPLPLAARLRGQTLSARRDSTYQHSSIACLSKHQIGQCCEGNFSARVAPSLGRTQEDGWVAEPSRYQSRAAVRDHEGSYKNWLFKSVLLKI